MHKVRFSAPGKLMLFGEHAVVYGRPCIVTAVNQRMKITVEIINEPVFILNAQDVNVNNYKKPISKVGKGDIPKGARFVEMAMKSFWGLRAKRGGLQNPGIKITTFSEFSSLFGFGSSSAVTVCVIKALSVLFDIKLTNKELFDLAYKTVLDIQGKGSGFDVAAAIYGGVLYFVTGGEIIEQLNIQNLPLLIGYSGVKADTVSIINQVAEKAENEPEIVENIYNEIAKIVESAKEAIVKSEWKKLGELMNKNQLLLQQLGVSTEKLDSMITAALNAGAYGAKLSGAGGGDCMINLVSEEKRKDVVKAIEKTGGQVIEVSVNAEGVRVEL